MKIAEMTHGAGRHHLHQSVKRWLTVALAALVPLAVSACADPEPVAVWDLEITDPSTFSMLPGFSAELVHAVDLDTEGSWVSLAADGKGRLVASDQTGNLWRITPAPIGADASQTVVQKIDVELGFAQGLLFVDDTLYVVANSSGRDRKGFDEGSENIRSEFVPPQSGLYRLTDTDNDDRIDNVEQLALISGGSEHGPHSIVLAPDGQSIFLVAGNSTDVPEIVGSSRVPQVWDEDQLTPVLLDPRGHANDRKAPGGWVAEVDLDGKNWVLHAVGMRNTYDIAVNPAGDVFGFDSDMEWDLGTPWYRPARILHLASGSDVGWRTGSSKWPSYYEDSLPALKNIGPASPTGMLFGKGAKYPGKYQQALFAFDWTFGTIYAVHLSPDGASYSADVEQFLSGQSLALTDGAIASDGAMYFITGGRDISSGLYRVVYTGDDATDPVDASFTKNQSLVTRKALEDLHRPVGKEAVDKAWRYLGSSDDFIRHAARIAVENQDIGLWRKQALAETRPRALITAMTALARHGRKADAGVALGRLSSLDWEKLDESLRLDLLRAYALVFIRMDAPAALKASTFANLKPQFPSGNSWVDRELARVLIYLDPAAMREPLLARLEQNNVADASVFDDLDADLLKRTSNGDYGTKIQAYLDNPSAPESMFYAYLLHGYGCGWSVEQYKRYYDWIKQGIAAEGGASYDGYLRAMRRVALECTPKEFQENALRSSLVEDSNVAGYLENMPIPAGPGQPWTVNGLTAALASVSTAPDFQRGKQMYKAGMCLACHSIDGQGGAVGPDLSGAGARFTRDYLLRSILQPSATISDQYANTVLTLKDGRQIIGRVVKENDRHVTIADNPFDLSSEDQFRVGDIQDRKESDTSPMPAGTINGMNAGEIADLLAFIEASGDRDHRLFKESGQ